MCQPRPRARTKSWPGFAQSRSAARTSTSSGATTRASGRSSFPFIPGHEWAGEIVALGPGADLYGWKVGDRVAGTSHDACGFCQKCVEGRYNLCENYGKPGLHKQYGHNYQGADATYVVQGVKTVFTLPDGISFEDGAIIDPASIALHVANRGGVAPGDAVAITGGGAIGLLSGDAALVRGASRVIVVRAQRGPSGQGR